MAAIGVQKPALGMVGHRVHGEVAPGEVLADVLDEAHHVGMAHVRVGALDAVGGRLHGQAIDDGRHRAVLGTRLVDLDAGGTQHAGGLLPRCRGRHVHIVAGPAHERVAHEASDDPGLEPGALERADDAQCVSGHLNVYRFGDGHVLLLGSVASRV